MQPNALALMASLLTEAKSYLLVASMAVAACGNAAGIEVDTQSTRSDALRNHETHKWFASWGAAHGVRLTTPSVSGQSVRMIIRPTTSGNRLRVKLENTMGKEKVVFSDVFVGVVADGASLVPGTNERLTFDHRPSVTLFPGDGVYSDDLSFQVDAFKRLAVSINVAYATDISVHRLGLAKGYMGPGALAANEGADGFGPIPEDATKDQGNIPFYWLAGLDVRTPEPVDGSIVVFGDSIADGVCSTQEGTKRAGADDLYHRWTDILAERLALLPNDEDKATNPKAVAVESVAGGALLIQLTGPAGLDRVDRDVLDRSGMSHVILALGTNDVALQQFTSAQVISGLQQVIDRVHAKGVKIVGTTIIPRPGPAWNARKESDRDAINNWIRNTANFDGVIDFAELLKGPLVVRNGALVEDIKPGFGCGDNIHPNPAGYRLMGEFVDVSLFTSPGKINAHDGDTHNHAVPEDNNPDDYTNY